MIARIFTALGLAMILAACGDQSPTVSPSADTYYFEAGGADEENARVVSTFSRNGSIETVGIVNSAGAHMFRIDGSGMTITFEGKSVDQIAAGQKGLNCENLARRGGTNSAAQGCLRAMCEFANCKEFDLCGDIAERDHENRFMYFCLGAREGTGINFFRP